MDTFPFQNLQSIRLMQKQIKSNFINKDFELPNNPFVATVFEHFQLVTNYAIM